MNQTELKQRTKQFALLVMELIDALPGTTVGKVVGGQLVRAGTSVGDLRLNSFQNWELSRKKPMNAGIGWN